MLRFLTCGESHGRMLFSLLDGVPAGLSLKIEDINLELWRRQQGYGRGNRQKIEKDAVDIIAGVRHGITTGAPLGMLIPNRDFDNWRSVMSVTEVDRSSPEVREQLEKKAIGKFRPGHADLAGTFKYRQKDVRDVLERASARETASRVAAGAVAKQILQVLGIEVISHVLQVGAVKTKLDEGDYDLAELEKLALESELFCADLGATAQMKELIKETWQSGNSLGGVIEVLAEGLPIGLGSYTQWDRKLDGQLAQAVMSVQAIKACEIGDGFAAAAAFGSNVHDALYASPPASAKSKGLPFFRKTNRAGGIEGGMTNGERLCLKAYMKPIPTMRSGLASVSFPGFQDDRAHYERSDVCAIAAASVVCKAMVCLVLANSILEKFGGDTIGDISQSFDAYTRFCHSPRFDTDPLTDISGKSLPKEILDVTGLGTGEPTGEPTGNEDAAGEF